MVACRTYITFLIPDVNY